MRWVNAALALPLLATACGPLLQAPPSPSPTPAPAVVRSTPRPTFTERPAATATPVRTARPAATPVPAGATPRPTPAVPAVRPALPYPVVNGTCSEWPTEKEVFTVMTQLALPPSVCLLRVTDASIDKTVCTVVGCVPVTARCAEQGSCIEVIEGENPHYVLVWFRPPPTLPAALAEGYTFTRHLCTLHQERTLIDAALRQPDWLATIEGTAFESAFTFFRLAYATDSQKWGVKPSDVENYKDVCAAWYYPYVRDQKVEAYQPLFLFAQKWLPR